MIPGSGRSPGEGNGNPLQYSCLEHSMDRGAWQATVHGVTKSRTQLSDFHFHFPFLCSLLLKSGSWVLVLLYLTVHSLGFPCGSDRKESACNARDPGLIPGSERSPGEGNGNPHQYSCLENSRAREAWWATVHGVAKSQTGLRD